MKIKKLTLKERKERLKTALEYFQKEKYRRNKEANKLNKLFTSYDV